MLDPARMDEVLRRGDREVAERVTHWKAEDARRRGLQHELDGLRAERNAANERMAKLDKKSAEFGAARDQLKTLGASIKTGETELGALEERTRDLLMHIPNAPHASVPDGNDEHANRIERTWGELPAIAAPRPHWEIGEALGILDFARAGVLSGARFCVLRGWGARLTRGLINYMIDLHTAAGYEEVWPPALIKRSALVGTGQLPKFEADLFRVQRHGGASAEPDSDGAHEPGNDLFLSPTAEVQVTNLHYDEILDAADLPRRYCAYAPCFRAEAGAYGKDTRGLIRQHQFDKVELVKLVEPSTSYAELDGLRDDAERVLQGLGLPYRVVTLCTGDLGFGAAKTFDLEVWLPGQATYREISSCSNFEDFQARRAKIRYRPVAGDKPRALHTINGSGLAVGRTIVAILENYQRPDGSVEIPVNLRPYVGGADRIPAR